MMTTTTTTASSAVGNKIKKSHKKTSGGIKISGGKPVPGLVKTIGVKRPNIVVSPHPHHAVRSGRKEQGMKARGGKNHSQPLSTAGTAVTAVTSGKATGATNASAASAMVSQSQRRKAFDQAMRARNNNHHNHNHRILHDVAPCNNSKNNFKSNNKHNNKTRSNNVLSRRLDAVTVTDLCSLLDDSSLGDTIIHSI